MWPENSYAQPTDSPGGSTADALNRLRDYLIAVPEKLPVYTEGELTEKPDGKWSKKEALGHLIDSALNNLKRFTEAPAAGDYYVIQPYAQDHLVQINRYQTLPLTHLLTLWRGLNAQILYVVDALPADVLTKPVRPAQGDSPDAPGRTLGWLVEDYVAHLEHHLKTLL